MREVTVLERLREVIGGLQMLNAVIESEGKSTLVSEQLDGCVQDLIDVEAVLRSRDDDLVCVTKLKVGMPKRNGDEDEAE